MKQKSKKEKKKRKRKSEEEIEKNGEGKRMRDVKESCTKGIRDLSGKRGRQKKEKSRIRGTKLLRQSANC